MENWEYFLLFLSVIAGGALGLYLRDDKGNRLRFLLSFSGAYILGITVLHILPGVYAGVNSTTGMWILGGFFIQLLLEQLSQGVEHGHIHAHKNANRVFAFQILLGLSLHAFLEGVPLSNYELLEHNHSHSEYESEFNHLLFGIVLHKAPAAFALTVLLIKSGMKPAFTIGCILIFSTMSPLGAFASSQLEPGTAILQNALALVAGSFLHISTTILFESDSSHHHHISWMKMGVIILGLAAALLTM
jgi:zinc transporter ZupT